MTCAAFSILEISDGTTTVNLLSERSGFCCADWTPTIAEPKGGGVWQDSPLSAGRQLVHSQLGNVIERFDLSVRDWDQDLLVRDTQNLRRLLEKAVQYWTSKWTSEPVWIKAQAPLETNPRYALIHDYRTPADGFPYGQPFWPQIAKAAIDEFTLLVERDQWTEAAPGTGMCVEAQAYQLARLLTNEATFTPAAGSDDASANQDMETFDLASTWLRFGSMDNESWDMGVRFRNVTIPQGSRIVYAWLTIWGHTALSGTVCDAIIFGQKSASAAAFSTLSDFNARPLTDARVEWDSIAAWLAGCTTGYSPGEITAIIQEIVNLDDWQSGNDLVLFVKDNYSKKQAYREGCAVEAGGNVTQLYVEWSAPDEYFGQEASCEDVAYFANKHNQADLTDVRTGNTATGWLAGNHIAWPYVGGWNFFAGPVDEDFIAFGITTTINGDTDVGPFCSLVFDISPILDVTNPDDCSVVWEYWAAGAVWSGLTVQDNTNQGGAMGGLAFDTEGVGSVHWDLRQLQVSGDWDITNQPTPAGANRPDPGYWVRARLNLWDTGVCNLSPQQVNRNIYTIIWPYIEIEADEVPGDITAILQIKAHNQSGPHPGVIGPDAEMNHLMVGLRSLSRGSDFSAYLNYAQEQHPEGITCTKAAGASGAFTVTHVEPTPTGDAYNIAAGPYALQCEVRHRLDANILYQYYGIFHAYVRLTEDSGIGGFIGVRLRITPTYSYPAICTETDVVYTETHLAVAERNMILDMGQIAIPPTTVSSSDRFDNMYIETWVVNDSNSITGQLVDLILLPIDEWAANLIQPIYESSVLIMSQLEYLDIDSLTYPKVVLRALDRYVSSDRIRSVFEQRTNGPAALQANAKQRLWFFAGRSLLPRHYDPWIGHSAQLIRNSRYLSMRGDR